MISSIIFLPLINSICVGFWGYKLGTKGTSLITLFCLSFTVFLSIFSLVKFSLLLLPQYISLGQWISVGSFITQWALMIDSLSLIMFVLVSTISFLVYLYVWLD